MFFEYVKELKPYTKADLQRILNFAGRVDEQNSCIKKLINEGVIRSKSGKKDGNGLSPLADFDFTTEDTDKYETDSEYYVFTFVGIIVVGGCVLKCYPKYFPENDECDVEVSKIDNDILKIDKEIEKIQNDSAQMEAKVREKEGLLKLKKEKCKYIDEHFKLVVSVLKKYIRSLNQDMSLFTGQTDTTTPNLLPLILFLLDDYYAYGLYMNTEDIVEFNGSGEIFWDKTINETRAIISNNRPYYTDLLTRKKVCDEHDYFKRLHECILTCASKELEEADLFDVLETSRVDLSDENLEYFGDDDTILYNFEKELNRQFNTRKRLVLEAMRDYVKSRTSFSKIDGLSLFGVRKFEHVWENVCAFIFDNKLDYTLEELSLKCPRTNDIPYNASTKLINCIDKPIWSAWPDFGNAGTLKPDIVYIDSEKTKFVIMDAKYYTPGTEQFSDETTGLPGVESVTKQYLYHMAYWPVICENNIMYVKNCFLMPTEISDDLNKGSVSMGMFSRLNKELAKYQNVTNNLGIHENLLNLEDIKVRFLPAGECYRFYLRDKHLNLEILKLDE